MSCRDVSHSDLTLCAEYLKWKSPIRGAETSAGNEGEVTAIEVKLIIVSEIMFGKVTSMDAMLNLTVA